MGKGLQRARKAALATQTTTQAERINQLEGQVRALDMRLRTLIVWMAQSANSPIRIDEAERLINEIGHS
jgi:acyl-CoA reductase-like NAD-dependent aldehyde dehydrogenase